MSKNEVTFYNVDEYRNLSHVYDFLPLFYKIMSLKTNKFNFTNNDNYKQRLIKIIKNHLNIKKKLKYTKITKS